MNKAFWKGKKILVTGGSGFLGKHLVKNLIEKRGIKSEQLKIINSSQFDLRDLKSAKKAVDGVDIVLHLASDVGGIGYSNMHPATQLRNCLLIDLNMFDASATAQVNKLVAVSSSVGYPEDAKSPLKEKDFFLGLPAKTGYGYGFAKRNTVVLTRAYRQEKGLNAVVVIPNNAYGPGEKVDLEGGHVIPSLIYKCLKYDSLNVWGDGKAIRDFLYIEDFAEGVVLAAEKLTTEEPVNLGSGVGISIKELVNEIVKLTNFKGKVFFDKDKPKGQKERVVDIGRAKKLLGFRPHKTIQEGLKETVVWIRGEA